MENTGVGNESSQGSNPGAMFTCIACHVAFRSHEEQKNHYKTEWHRYNLKRKVAGLPPVTSEDFDQRLELQQKQVIEEENSKSLNRFECTICRKTYSSENAFQNHLKSKKHKENVVKHNKNMAKLRVPTADVITNKGKGPVALDPETASISSEDTSSSFMNLDEEYTDDPMMAEMDAKIASAPKLKYTECLFCNHVSGSLEENLEHMMLEHSFFIPDIEYVIDLKGLITYLGQKMSVGNICLYCGKGFNSLDAVRKHMIDKGHCKIRYEDGDELEFAEFYDFSSSYPQEEELEGSCGDMVVSGEDLPEESITYDETELVLPSGSRIGHRSFKRYYKQHLRAEEEREDILINKLAGQYKSLGWYDSNELSVAERIDQRQRLNRHKSDRLRVGVKANKLQHHFRLQILQ